MSIKSAPYYWAVCDCCGERADYGDFSAWSDEGQARDYDEASFQYIDGADLCAACWCWPEDLSDYPGDEAWPGPDDPVRRHTTHPEKETTP